MSEQPSLLSDRPEEVAREPDTMVRDGLRCLKLSGSVFLRAHFSSPWAYESPNSSQTSAMLNAGDRRVILFHVITEGRCRLELTRGGGMDFSAGDIAILPFADQHRMGDPNVESAVPLSEILPNPQANPVLRYGGGGPPMSMVCGYLFSDDVPFNPVLRSLPPLIRIPTADGPLGGWVEASIRYAMHVFANQRMDSDPILQRLPELLFIECLSDFAAKQPGRDQGWLAGLVDPIVGRALACMHREPERPWTLEALAKRAASSRSVLDDRFRQLLGQAPMSYLTAWRLQLASRRLRTSNDTLADIADAVGYGSEASFSRAFKRHVGVSPSEWRAAG
jgi:AraC-like DNA-binding protein